MIETARELFFRSGFSRVTMDDLAARLGVGKATLYKVFSGKEDVLVAVVQRVVSETVGRFEYVMADSTAGFVERISFVLQTIGTLFASISPLLFEDMRRYAPHIWEAINTVRHDIARTNFEKLLRGGIQAGVFRDDLDIDLVLDMFISQIERHINPDAILRSGRSASDTLATIIRVFFQGLLTEPGRSKFSDRLDVRIPPLKEGQA
ncbi:MAG: helix-turn-helix domain containing protein [Acidobacteriota bacterium]|nr:helix-turn-helix domain containing protein [Acidobacteriota bacterium]